MSIVIKAPSGGGSVSFDTQQSVTGDHTLQLPTGVGSANQYLRNSGTAGTLEFGDLPSSVVFTEKTAVSPTSGTAVNFTNIPANAYRITVMLDQVSTNGTNNLMLGIGSGTIETSGYKGSAGAGTASGVYASRDPGFCLSYNNNSAASYAHSGSVILTNLTGNTWTLQGATFTGAYGVGAFIGGVKTLSGTLDRVQVYTNGGVDTFDAGTINIIYEVQ